MSDKIEELLADLNARDRLGVRIIRNEKNGASAMLPVTITDEEDWEQRSLKCHEKQRNESDKLSDDWHYRPKGDDDRDEGALQTLKRV